jgi:hypothetical protein
MSTRKQPIFFFTIFGGTLENSYEIKYNSFFHLSSTEAGCSLRGSTKHLQSIFQTHIEHEKFLYTVLFVTMDIKICFVIIYRHNVSAPNKNKVKLIFNQ